ncbi:MAG: DNA replication and repair protein RecF, partial [Bacteroidota bacterium]
MYLQKISLANFKNYEHLDIELCPEINCLLGENGSGKTNLLDAIHYLSMSKSAFNSIDSQNILHQENYFTIQGSFEKEQPYLVFCGVQKGQKKILRLDKQPYDRISEHIGRFPVVLIAPHDHNLINDGSETRRKHFDSIFSQISPDYLKDLLAYHYYLKQRNSLLKDFQEKNYLDRDLLLSYDQQLLPLNQKLYGQRQAFIQEYLPILVQNYEELSRKKEAVSIRLDSQVGEKNFALHYQKSLDRDIRSTRTHFGAHRDNYLFEINAFPLKKFGSQGQQKTFILALKLAQFAFIKKYTSIKPLLLLDDIFDKLDDLRIESLMRMIARREFGQIFITDARPERSKQFLGKIPADRKIFLVQKGMIQ